MSDAAPVLDRKAILHQCRAAVEKRLSQQLEPLLDALPKQLDEIGRQSRDREERDQYLTAQSRLVNDRAAFFEGFRKEFGECFEAYAQALQGTARPISAPNRDQLAMMKTNVLENEVAAGKLAVRLKEHAAAELAELSARLAALFNRGALGDGDNPLGPIPIARAVCAGFTALNIESRPMRTIRAEIEKKLGEPVRELYQAVNATFASLVRAPAAQGSAAVPASAPAAAAPGGAAPAAAEAAAMQAVESALAGTSLPPIIDRFLRQAWVRLLARAHAVQGPEGAPWREAVATMQELVWSLKPKADPAERARLAGLLPILIKKVTAGMEAVALNSAGRKAVLDELTARHREILQPPGKSGGC